MPECNWVEPPPPDPGAPPLHADPLLDAVLRGRVGSADAAVAFLDANQRPAPDPFALPNMRQAIVRLRRAVAERERIAVFGDYDVDGVASTALLVEALTTAGLAPTAHLPTRATGYGLNDDAVRGIAATGATLLIAVDCGSGDHGPVALARSLGLDVVVVDHHQMRDAGPDGAIVVSAQLATGSPYRDLSASGLAYLVAAALAADGVDLGRGAGREPRHLLDLAALGLVADVCSLAGINRPLVRDGLRWISARRRPGLATLVERTLSPTAAVSSGDVAFKLAPRLNAAGRMADPKLALDLLLTKDPVEAATLAICLDGLNRERRLEAGAVAAAAERSIAARADLDRRRVLVATGAGWSAGVLGLAAGRLAERFGRPVLILSDDGAYSRGSARSVPGFDIAAALAACDDLLDHHGGHGQAAGLSLPSANVALLETRLTGAIEAAGVPIAAANRLAIDADLPPDRIDVRTADALRALEPCGAGNPPPLLRLRGARVTEYRTIGRDDSHLKLRLRTARGEVDVVLWGGAKRSRELAARLPIDVVGTLSVNEWNGRRRVQIEAKDFRVADEATPQALPQRSGSRQV